MRSRRPVRALPSCAAPSGRPTGCSPTWPTSVPRDDPSARRARIPACGRSPHTLVASMKVAIVGAGVSGLVVAHLLQRDHQVTVFEAGDYAGGHTNTVRVDTATQ